MKPLLLEFLTIEAYLFPTGFLYFILSIAFFHLSWILKLFSCVDKDFSPSPCDYSTPVIWHFSLSFLLISISSSCSFSLAGVKSWVAISLIAFFTFWMMKSSVGTSGAYQMIGSQLNDTSSGCTGHRSIPWLDCLSRVLFIKYFTETVGVQFSSMLLVFDTIPVITLFPLSSTNYFLLFSP